MQPLDLLARDAAALARGEPVQSAAEAEVARQMRICNACRYCEGFCAVFPAMTRRLEFGKADIHFLANLCHNCTACLHACQYAPPHEFAVNVPQAMAKVRRQTYADYAWPPALGALYRRNGATLAIAGGLVMLVANPFLLRQPWMHIKLTLAVVVLGLHGLTRVKAKKLSVGEGTFPAWVLGVLGFLLVAIVSLAILKTPAGH